MPYDTTTHTVSPFLLLAMSTCSSSVWQPRPTIQQYIFDNKTKTAAESLFEPTALTLTRAIGHFTDSTTHLYNPVSLNVSDVNKFNSIKNMDVVLWISIKRSPNAVAPMAKLGWPIGRRWIFHFRSSIAKTGIFLFLNLMANICERSGPRALQCKKASTPIPPQTVASHTHSTGVWYPGLRNISCRFGTKTHNDERQLLDWNP